MTCDVQDGACINCGSRSGGSCRAELPLTLIRKMLAGEIPRACVRITRTQWAALSRDAPPKTSTCIHLGAPIREQRCEGCKGEVRLKVFACAVHGECTFGKLAGVVSCPCGDYVPATLSPDTMSP